MYAGHEAEVEAEPVAVPVHVPQVPVEVYVEKDTDLLLPLLPSQLPQLDEAAAPVD